jgi:DNA-binding transcriptional LysR family regulator
MALLRLLALSGAGLALVPRIVVERELAAGDAELTGTIHVVSTSASSPLPACGQASQPSR